MEVRQTVRGLSVHVSLSVPLSVRLSLSRFISSPIQTAVPAKSACAANVWPDACASSALLVHAHPVVPKGLGPVESQLTKREGKAMTTPCAAPLPFYRLPGSPTAPAAASTPGRQRNPCGIASSDPSQGRACHCRSMLQNEEQNKLFAIKFTTSASVH